jgi:hypothetical protein
MPAMAHELLRMAVVYVHLLACCVAIGLLITNDVAMIKSLIRADASHVVEVQHLRGLQKLMTRALQMLWLSGVAIVAMDVAIKGWDCLGNPKLQSKLVVVIVLTLNGAALHHLVLPHLHRAGSVLRLSWRRQQLALLAGSVSAVSWLYAALLGVGRPLNWKFSMLEILACYPVLIAGGFFGLGVLCSRASARTLVGQPRAPAITAPPPPIPRSPGTAPATGSRKNRTAATAARQSGTGSPLPAASSAAHRAG